MLEVCEILVGDLGLHWAVLGPAHRAKLGLLVDICRQSFVVILASSLRIKAQIKLFVPVEGISGAAEFVVAIARAGAMAGDVSGMGSDLVSDQAIAYIFWVGETEVLLRSHIAKHRRAIPTSHGRADGAGDVVVARGDVGN